MRAREAVLPADLVLPIGAYQLELLRHVRRDDLGDLLGQSPGVYLCNAPEPDWYEHFGLVRRQNPGLERKRAIFASMHPDSVWLSPTHAEAQGARTSTWRSPVGIVHLGNRGFKKRLGQLVQLVQVLWWLGRNKSAYSYVLVYNFDLPQFFAALVAKWIFGKRLVVEYADDYVAFGGSWLKRQCEKRLRAFVDAAICIHPAMCATFDTTIPTPVVSSFADLNYVEDCELREGMRWLFSGRLDDIRGVELIPQLVETLRARLKDFQILITGTGPLQNVVQGWRIDEVRYLGFLPDQELAQVTDRVDACLVLQKPDHPFSRGSFPSKIEIYARAHKPIYRLVPRG